MIASFLGVSPKLPAQFRESVSKLLHAKSRRLLRPIFLSSATRLRLSMFDYA
jgi:hypothetical protein